MNKLSAIAIAIPCIYLGIAIALVIWYLIRPAEQLIWLGLISLPADLLFFALGSKDWPALIQALAITTCGVTQYGILGALVALFFKG